MTAGSLFLSWLTGRGLPFQALEEMAKLTQGGLRLTGPRLWHTLPGQP